MNNEKSIAESIYDEIIIEKEVFILKFNNESEENQLFRREVSSSFIQFHFCVKGSASFSFNNGSYRIPVNEETSLLLYNPERDLPIEVVVNPQSWVISLLFPMIVKQDG